MDAPETKRNWRNLTITHQFVLAGGAVMLVAMILVGSWVSQRIEQAALQNFAITAANYIESFIAPITQELAEGDELSPPAQQAMIEIFSGTALNERIVSYKIWKPGGLVVHASDPSLIGQRFPPSEDQESAWNGLFAASFEDLHDQEDANEAMLDVPLLEVYSPIHELFSGRIIAVAEFYERADPLKQELRDARRTTWLVVGSVFAASGLLLFGIVQTGGRTIKEQKESLQSQLISSKQLAEQNNQLRRRAITANLRATAQMEQAIRRVGSDLHDGPAQHLSLAALRLDNAFDSEDNMNARNVIRRSIDQAMEEIRTISRGLALPELEELDILSLVQRAVSEREQQSALVVDTVFNGAEPKSLRYTEKLCIYRFLQEGLSNAIRHGKANTSKVLVECCDGTLSVTIQDDGAGFDLTETLPPTSMGGQGLLGLKDRAESIGGTFTIQSTPGTGTSLKLVLPTEASI